MPIKKSIVKRSVGRPVGRPRKTVVKKPTRQIRKVRGGCNGDIRCKRCGGCNIRGGSCAECGYDFEKCGRFPYNDPKQKEFCDARDIAKYQRGEKEFAFTPYGPILEAYRGQVNIPQTENPDTENRLLKTALTKLVTKESKRLQQDPEKLLKKLLKEKKPKKEKYQAAPPPSSSGPSIPIVEYNEPIMLGEDYSQELYSPERYSPVEEVPLRKHTELDRRLFALQLEQEELEQEPNSVEIRAAIRDNKAEQNSIIREQIEEYNEGITPRKVKRGKKTYGEYVSTLKKHTVEDELRHLEDVLRATEEEKRQIAQEAYRQKYRDKVIFSQTYPSSFHPSEQARNIPYVNPQSLPVTETLRYPELKKSQANSILDYYKNRDIKKTPADTYNYDPKLLAPNFTFGNTKARNFPRTLLSGPAFPPVPLTYFEEPAKKVKKPKTLSKDISKALKQIKAARTRKAAPKKKAKKVKKVK